MDDCFLKPNKFNFKHKNIKMEDVTKKIILFTIFTLLYWISITAFQSLVYYYRRPYCENFWRSWNEKCWSFSMDYFLFNCPYRNILLPLSQYLLQKISCFFEFIVFYIVWDKLTYFWSTNFWWPNLFLSWDKCNNGRNSKYFDEYPWRQIYFLFVSRQRFRLKGLILWNLSYNQ